MSVRKKAKSKYQSTVINVSAAKASLSALLEEVAQGKKIILGKAGKPIASLVPYQETKSIRKFGALKNKIKYSDLEFSEKELKDLFEI